MMWSYPYDGLSISVYLQLKWTVRGTVFVVTDCSQKDHVHVCRYREKHT